MLKSLVYTSSAATFDVTDDELNEILEASRSNNKAAGVTGMLLFAEGSFIQVLEGAPADVDEIYARICADPRHDQLLKLYDHPIPNRNFPEWSMGYRVAQSGDFPPRMFSLRPDALAKLEHEKVGAEILALLKSFYKAAYRFEPI